jgi:inositol phosphorylceramide mannosyltransferase catalytic subunit
MLTTYLHNWNYHYILPYISIHYGAGQWFITDIWERYHHMLPSTEESSSGEDHRLHRVMMDMRPGSARWVFFTAGRGGSWNNWDNRVFGYIGDHLILVAIVVVGSVSLTIWLCLRSMRRARGYKRLPPRDEDLELSSTR